MADERLLLAHLADSKDAGYTEISHLPGRTEQRLQAFTVRCGHVVMRIGGVFRSAGDQQIWLDHPDWKDGHLARLCITPSHDGEAHWHRFEGPGRARRVYPAPINNDADLASPAYLVTEVFVPTMKIQNLFYAGRLA